MSTSAIQMAPLPSNTIDGNWKSPTNRLASSKTSFATHRQHRSTSAIVVTDSNFNLKEAMATAPKTGTGIPPSPNPRAALLANLRTAPRVNSRSPDLMPQNGVHSPGGLSSLSPQSLHPSPMRSPQSPNGFPARSPGTPRSPPSVSALHFAAMSASARNNARQATKNVPRPLDLAVNNASLSAMNHGMINGRHLPHSATLPPKTANRLGLTPRTATFPNNAPMEYMQMLQQQRTPYSPDMMYSPQYQSFALPQTPTTPMLVLSRPGENGDVLIPGTPAPYVLPANQQYHNIAIGYDEEGPYAYYYDYEVEYMPPTPSGTTHVRHKSASNGNNSSSIGGAKYTHQRSVSSTSSNGGGAERRKARLDPDAILPIRQPRGPDLSKNFVARIRRRNIKTILTAAAERRSGTRGDNLHSLGNACSPMFPRTPKIQIDNAEENYDVKPKPSTSIEISSAVTIPSINGIAVVDTFKNESKVHTEFKEDKDLSVSASNPRRRSAIF